MNTFLALDLELFEPGDLVPAPIFIHTSQGFVRILDAGQCVIAANIAAWRAQYGHVLIPAHMCSAFGDHAESQLTKGHVRLISGVIVARLSQLAFGAITAPTLSSIERVAQRMMHLSHTEVVSVLESGTVIRALPWVQSHAACAALMTLVVRAQAVDSSQAVGLIFAALVHDLDRLVRPSSTLASRVNENSITLSILARYHPVQAHVHEALTQFCERADGSGGPFGYSGNQISRYAQYLGIVSWLCRDGVAGLSSFRTQLEGSLTLTPNAFKPELVQVVLASLSSLNSISDHQSLRCRKA